MLSEKLKLYVRDYFRIHLRNKKKIKTREDSVVPSSLICTSIVHFGTLLKIKKIDF